MEMHDRIQKLRKDANHSQEQLAETLGVSRQAVSKWESGQAMPELGNIIKISEIYNVSTDYILTGRQSDNTDNTDNTDKKDELISKKAKSVIAVIAAITLAGWLFIFGLTMISKIAQLIF